MKPFAARSVRVGSESWTLDAFDLYIRIATAMSLLTASTGGYCRLFRPGCPALRNKYIFLKHNVSIFRL